MIPVVHSLDLNEEGGRRTTLDYLSVGRLSPKGSQHRRLPPSYIKDIEMLADKLLKVCNIQDFKEMSDRYLVKCRKNRDSDPSCHLDKEQGFFKCFSCGAKGGPIQFIMYRLGVSYREAIDLLGSRSISLAEVMDLMQKPKGSKNQKKLKPFDLKNTPFVRPTGKFDDYCNSRGITQDLIHKFNILCCPHQNGVNWAYAGYLILPITLNHVCYGFVARNVCNKKGKRYLNSFGLVKTKLLYGYDQWQQGKHNEVIITEGPFNVLRLHAAGITTGVATFNTECSESQSELVGSLGAREVWMAYDRDEPGKCGNVKFFKEYNDMFEIHKWFYTGQASKAKDPGEVLIEQLEYRYNPEFVRPYIKKSMKIDLGI